jgi:hypothetical protein
MVTEITFLGAKQPEPELTADLHLCVFVEDELSSPICLHGIDRDNFNIF